MYGNTSQQKPAPYRSQKKKQQQQQKEKKTIQINK